MKRTIFTLILMLALGMTASAQESFAKQFKGKEGFTCVTIGKAAMKMMSTKGKLSREGFSGKLNIGNFADKVERLEVVSASTPTAADTLSNECKKWIEKDSFECIVDVDENGNQASIYTKTGGDINIFLVLAQDKETSVIIIYGTMTLDDIQGSTSK